MRLIVPMPGNENFAESLARAGGWALGHLEMRRFPDEESYVRLLSEVRGRSVDLVCSLARPDAGFLSLMFAADAARDLGAAEVNLVAPYLAYMRQDCRFLAGEAVTSRTFARLLSASFDRITAVDPHLHRYPTLASLYTTQTQVLHAAPLLADWIKVEVAKPLIIGPDVESDQWVSSVAGKVGAPHAVARKIRRGDREVEIALPDLSEWRDRQPVLIDDICSSGRTLIETAGELRLRGFPRPICVVVHALFSDDAYKSLGEASARIVSTDAVNHSSNAITLAPMIAEALLSPGVGPC
jgi:ribose-phosphate pyrophosphokinase